MVEGLALAEVIDAVLQRVEQQGVFDLTVRGQHGDHDVAHRAHFADGFRFWQRLFEVVEKIVEDDVFGEQGFGDFHERKGVCGVCADSVSLRAGAIIQNWL